MSVAYAEHFGPPKIVTTICDAISPRVPPGRQAGQMQFGLGGVFEVTSFTLLLNDSLNSPRLFLKAFVWLQL